MKQETLMCKLFNFSTATYYKKKRENNLALHLIEKYFSKEDINEYLTCYSINRMNILQDIESNLNGELIHILDYFIYLFNLHKKNVDIIFTSQIFIEHDIKIAGLLHLYPDFSKYITFKELEEIIDSLENHNLFVEHAEVMKYITSHRGLGVLVKNASYYIELNNRTDYFNIAILLYISNALTFNKNFSSNDDWILYSNKIYEEHKLEEYNDEMRKIDILGFSDIKIAAINKSIERISI